MSRLNWTARVLLVVYLLVAVAQVIAEAAGWQLADGIALVVLMPVLAAFLLAARTRRDRLSTLVLIALIWSWLGDTVGGVDLLAKIGLFLIAQISYIVAFWPFRRRSALTSPGSLVGYLVVIGGMIVLVALESGGLWPAIVIYGLGIGLMAISASGLNRVAALGGVVFVVSDLALALSTFASRGPVGVFDAVVMPTYVAAQLLLVLGVISHQWRDAAAPTLGTPELPGSLAEPGADVRRTTR